MTTTLEIGADGLFHPETEEQIVALVKRAAAEGKQLRVLGSTHSVWKAIVTDHFDGPDTPDSEIAVVLDGPRSSGTGWLVPFEASNRGDRPAGQLTLELTAGDERAETTVDFLAAHSSIRGGFFLSGDPGASPLKARALGFVEP